MQEYSIYRGAISMLHMRSALGVKQGASSNSHSQTVDKKMVHWVQFDWTDETRVNGEGRAKEDIGVFLQCNPRVCKLQLATTEPASS